MPASKPLWRRAVETADSYAAPVVEGVMKDDRVGLGLGLLQQTRRSVYRRTERMSRRLLHQLNLPTASDVNRLLVQIAAVENRVRMLSTQMEGMRPSVKDAAALPARSDVPAP